MLATTGACIAVGILLPFEPLGRKLGLESLPGSYFPLLAAILVSYLLLTQVVKGWYLRKYRMWL